MRLRLLVACSWLAFMVSGGVVVQAEDADEAAQVSEQTNNATWQDINLLYASSSAYSASYALRIGSASREASIVLCSDAAILSLEAGNERFDAFTAMEGGQEGVTIVHTRSDGTRHYVAQPGSCPVQIPDVYALHFDAQLRELYVYDGEHTKTYAVDALLGQQFRKSKVGHWHPECLQDLCAVI